MRPYAFTSLSDLPVRPARSVSSTVPAWGLHSDAQILDRLRDGDLAWLTHGAFASPNAQQVLTFRDKKLELSIGSSQKLIDRCTARSLSSWLQLNQILSWRLDHSLE